MLSFKFPAPLRYLNILFVSTFITLLCLLRPQRLATSMLGMVILVVSITISLLIRQGSNQVNISDYIFYKGNTYTFHKISGNNHPFYLSDIPNNSSGSYHYGTKLFNQ